MSETSKARDKLIKYCSGAGVDLGCGHDKICPEAFGFDLPNPYAKMGEDLIQLSGDAKNLTIFKDGVLDYVYSSHLLEDFMETEIIMKEWVRTIRTGGNLILVLPDELVYREFCKNNNIPSNPGHKLLHFNKDWVKHCAKNLGNLEIIDESDIYGDYCFFIVFKKVK